MPILPERGCFVLLQRFEVLSGDNSAEEFGRQADCEKGVIQSFGLYL